MLTLKELIYNGVQWSRKKVSSNQFFKGRNLVAVIVWNCQTKL